MVPETPQIYDTQQACPGYWANLIKEENVLLSMNRMLGNYVEAYTNKEYIRLCTHKLNSLVPKSSKLEEELNNEQSSFFNSN